MVGDVVRGKTLTLLKDSEGLHRRGLKYAETKNRWPRSQGGDRNLADDLAEQSKNRKMHRHA